MYLNNLKINSSKIFYKLLLTIGIVGTILTGAVLIFAAIDGMDSVGGFVFCLLIFLFNIFLIYRFVVVKRNIENAFFYSRYFEGDLDGYIYTSALRNITNKDTNTINSELKKLINKHYLTNVELEQKNNMYVIKLLSQTEKCQCKNCGAVFNKSVNFTGTCPYCGSSDVFAKAINKQ